MFFGTSKTFSVRRESGRALFRLTCSARFSPAAAFWFSCLLVLPVLSLAVLLLPILVRHNPSPHDSLNFRAPNPEWGKARKELLAQDLCKPVSKLGDFACRPLYFGLCLLSSQISAAGFCPPGILLLRFCSSRFFLGRPDVFFRMATLCLHNFGSFIQLIAFAGTRALLFAFPGRRLILPVTILIRHITSLLDRVCVLNIIAIGYQLSRSLKV